MPRDHRQSPNRARSAFAAMGLSEDGIEAARKLVSKAAGPDASAAFALFARLYAMQRDDSFDLSAFDALGWPRAGLKERLREAAEAFLRTFAMPLIGGFAQQGDDTDAGDHITITIAPALKAFFAQDPVASMTSTTLLDSEATTWATIAVTAARSKSSHHLAMRCAKDDRRSGADFAALVAATGARVIYWQGEGAPQTMLLAAELFGGADTVVVADGLYLVDDAPEKPDSEWDAPPASPGSFIANPCVAAILPWLEIVQATYVWRVPEHGVLPPEIRRLVAATFGPLRQDPDWRAAHLKCLAPGIAAFGLRSLLAQVDDARDAEAMARLAVALAEAGVPGASTVDAACGLVANSQAGARPVTAMSDAQFDEQLIACGPDGLRLLGRGRTLAQGSRVLVHGPPGGGKSSYARALATRIAEAAGSAAIMVEPAALLARSWGATERLVAALWQKAQRANAPLVADEFDSLAGVRDADAPSSGNGHLIRVLTNEWLRQMDAYPRVPLIVTVNDIEALDSAVRRRFAIVIEVQDELSAEQERLAWASIFELDPPQGWSPSKASVGDFASARERCRALGREDAEAHAVAVEEARAVRLGPGKTAGRIGKKGRLH